MSNPVPFFIQLSQLLRVRLAWLQRHLVAAKDNAPISTKPRE